MITNPYKDSLKRSRFIAEIDDADYQTFKSLFPRHGTTQSYVNTLTHDIIEHARRNVDLIPGDPSNEQWLVEQLNLIRSTLRRRANTALARRPTTLNERRTATTLCKQPSRSTNNATDVSSKA